MRIALCLRGISYLSDYKHPGSSVQLHDLDFRNTAPSIQKNIIDPFKKLGYDVDVYFVTYHSELENELIKYFNPIDSIFTNYQQRNYHSNTINILNHHLQCIELYRNYELTNNIKYDQVIITRFDLYFYKSILDIGIDYNYVNLSFYHHGERNIFSSEDNFLMYPGEKTELVYRSVLNVCNNMYNAKLNIGRTSHNIADFILEEGETIKYLFGEKGGGPYDYPFYKFARHIFGPKKEIASIEESLKIPMKRIYHFKEEKELGCGIYYHLQKGISITPF